ncbi:GNAT family N-acetyltransferase [Kosakonia sacchari]|uniref:GNAT family N-acetyltransferase n=1 Tax=Kosakonia sacchari TaxID=1158459 RepID=UPI001584EF24|nr:GNAT family N-acetyltransferase [Kosakonia sacchari]MDN2485826.1 N-acetyltransferase family protein [Kosakonia sacchari]NUL37269.1 N-acetyltransferase family protein [Kosakonia sacchari]
MEIIDAQEHHLSAIVQIYAYHVTHGNATFETEAPDVDEMRTRLAKTRCNGLPWYVAVHEGQVRGYCYLSRYRERRAYQYTLEDSIYVDDSFRQQGAGKALLARAVAWAEQNGYRQLIANVGNSENEGSLRLHSRAGFVVIGTLKSVGMKHGRWLDTVLMQRPLGEGDVTLPRNNFL